MKLIYKELILILSVIVVIIALVMFPVKKAVKRDFNAKNSSKVTNNDTTLICEIDWTDVSTKYTWKVIGKDNVMFNVKSGDTIRVKGNLPSDILNHSLYNCGNCYNNIFIFWKG